MVWHLIDILWFAALTFYPLLLIPSLLSGNLEGEEKYIVMVEHKSLFLIRRKKFTSERKNSLLNRRPVLHTFVFFAFTKKNVSLSSQQAASASQIFCYSSNLPGEVNIQAGISQGLYGTGSIPPLPSSWVLAASTLDLYHLSRPPPLFRSYLFLKQLLIF